MLRGYDEDEGREGRWHPVTAAGLIGASLVTVVILWFANTGERWVPILDSANLAFHEAGHPLFGILSRRLGVYGGTLMQLLIPAAAVVSFWRQGHALAFGLMLVWFNQNLFNIARYMGDARAQILPLVGGGDHDWTEILTRWGVLHLDGTLSGTLRFFAWVGILAAWGWLAWRWWQDRELAE